MKFKSFIHLARPHQYMKNGFVWLPLFFAGQVHNLNSVLHTFYAFIAFCLAASSIYIINDIKDAEEDKLHPIKKFRPIASGELNRFEAGCFFIILLLLTGILSFYFLPNSFLYIVGGYIILNLAYSGFLKHIAIIDVVCIAMGFVLRVRAGGIAGDVAISPWIMIMTFLLAMFLALAKRRDDLLLSDDGIGARKSLDGYNLEFVSASMIVMASVIIVSYILYSVSPEVIEKHGTANLYLASFWVIVGLLRYMQITFVEKQSGSPTMILLKDYMLKAIVILWLLSIYLLIYL
jgi:decaprenyl-phosphate phosphoribosyltransferase